MKRTFHFSLHSHRIYKRLKRLICQHLHEALCRCGTNFDKIDQIGLKLALREKCWLAAFIVASRLGLAVGIQGCSGLGTLETENGVPHLSAQITTKHDCDHTDVLATRRFALLVKSPQGDKKIQCGNSCRRMLTLFEQFGAVVFRWCRNGVPRPLFQHYTPGFLPVTRA